MSSGVGRVFGTNRTGLSLSLDLRCYNHSLNVSLEKAVMNPSSIFDSWSACVFAQQRHLVTIVRLREG